MREQNEKRIVIVQPKQECLVLPPISQPSNQYRNLPQTELSPENTKKQKSRKIKISSLDKICLRECCKRKHQVDEKNVAQVKAKKQHFMGINKRNSHSPFDIKHQPSRKNETVSRHKKRTLTQQGSIRPKNKIYFLHNLKSFQPEDMDQYCNDEMKERQTRHKVNISQNHHKLIEWKDNFKKNHNGPKKHHYSPSYEYKYQQNQEKQSQNQCYEKDPYIYHERGTPTIKQIQKSKESNDKDDARTSPTKRYYKYIQNCKTIDENRTPINRKAQYSQYDENKSETSYFKSEIRKENSTIFHSHKIKFGSSLKQSLIRSSRLISKDQSLKIPKTEEQQTKFLLHYKPLDPDFNLRSIVAKQNFKILEKDDKIYFGQVREGLKHGLGILLSEKQIFEGQFILDEKLKGREKTRQGMYIGAFVKGLRDGQAKFIWKNGEQFIGEWKKGKKEGHGTWRSPKGDFYEGQWRNNKQNGKGIFIHVQGSKYSGYFKDFLKHGKGEQQFANGDKYTGQYKYGKPHGFGKYVWANADTYQGEFCQGSRQGQGTLTKNNQGSYQGTFVNDMKEGEGIQLYPNGEYFEGWFQQDKRIKGKLYNKKGILLQQLK